MLFPQVKYMHWAKTVPAQFTYNLTASGIAMLATTEELALKESDIQLSGNNFYGYPMLRTAIAARYRVPEKNILITQGTSLANFLIAAALVNPGEEVLVEQPAYEPLLTIFESLQVKVNRLSRSAEHDFAFDMEELRAKLSGRTKVILISTLHNPSGKRVPEKTIRELSVEAARMGATVVVDEVYQDFLSPRITPAFLLGENIVTTNSLTKVYGLGGLRVGWAFADEKIVANAYRAYNNLGVNNCFPGDHLAAVMMTRGTTEMLAERARARAAAHWKITEEWLSTRPELVTSIPDGGIMCYPQFIDPRSSQAFVALLQQKFDTTVVPGNFFEDDRGFRLGFGCEKNILLEGLNRLGDALELFCKG